VHVARSVVLVRVFVFFPPAPLRERS
jgi:hypothetical protein